MHQIIEVALANGDITRAGLLAAAQSIDRIDLGGSAPDQTYAGTANDFVVRASGVAKPDLELYLAAGGAEQTMSQAGATTGSVVAEEFFISDIAANFEFTEPCYTL